MMTIPTVCAILINAIPQLQVDVGVVRISPKATPSAVPFEIMEAVARTLFHARRKLLRNNMKYGTAFGLTCLLGFVCAFYSQALDRRHAR